MVVYKCNSYIRKLIHRPQGWQWVPTVRVCGYSCKLELGRYVMPVLIQAITHVLGEKGGPHAGLELGETARRWTMTVTRRQAGLELDEAFETGR